ncbi:hypothetical protein F4861DRAFT_12164 [Xylaria intraflava]|nr:hypothetical protein F4861DRAFT_12164 [Xylaria intraflava]
MSCFCSLLSILTCTTTYHASFICVTPVLRMDVLMSPTWLGRLYCGLAGYWGLFVSPLFEGGFAINFLIDRTEGKREYGAGVAIVALTIVAVVLGWDRGSTGKSRMKDGSFTMNEGTLEPNPGAISDLNYLFLGKQERG